MADKTKPTKWWTVRSSSIHQRGIFAACDIPNDTRIIEYVGEKITKAESARRAEALMKRAQRTGGAAVYIFSLNKRQDIDGGKPGNTARLINHSCEPNCEAYNIGGRIWIMATRDIRKGEELTYNYGFDLETWEDHECRCGKPSCVGYIVGKEHWKKLKALVAKKNGANGHVGHRTGSAHPLNGHSDNGNALPQTNGRKPAVKKRSRKSPTR